MFFNSQEAVQELLRLHQVGAICTASMAEAHCAWCTPVVSDLLSQCAGFHLIRAFAKACKHPAELHQGISI